MSVIDYVFKQNQEKVLSIIQREFYIFLRKLLYIKE